MAKVDPHPRKSNVTASRAMARTRAFPSARRALERELELARPNDAQRALVLEIARAVDEALATGDAETWRRLAAAADALGRSREDRLRITLALSARVLARSRACAPSDGLSEWRDANGLATPRTADEAREQMLLRLRQGNPGPPDELELVVEIEGLLRNLPEQDPAFARLTSVEVRKALDGLQRVGERGRRGGAPAFAAALATACGAFGFASDDEGRKDAREAFNAAAGRDFGYGRPG